MEHHEEPVCVGPSRNGLGVFSLRSIGIHEVLGPIRGTIIVDADYESDYCMAIGDCSALEPAPPFRYVNHSCRPNCSLMESEVEYADGAEGFELWLRVDEAIDPGEELTIDYAWPANNALPCHCGSADCRNWIVAADQVGKIVPKHSPG